jgi:hypothetical protein
MVLDISQTYFFIEIGPLSEPDLVSFAERVFDQFDRAAARYLPRNFENYELRLLVEEGSVEGRSNLLVAASALHLAITGTGELISSLKEIGWLSGEVSSRVAEAAVKESGASASRIRVRRGKGVVGKLHKLFHDVEEKRLHPDEATMKVIELLESEGDVSDQMLGEIRGEFHDAFQYAADHPGQLDLDLALDPGGVELPPSTPAPPRRRPETPAIPHTTVEIVKEGREGKPRVRTRH